MESEKLKNLIEAVLLASDEPLSVNKIHKILNSKTKISKSDILSSIDDLKQDYENKNIEIIQVASGLRIQAKDEVRDYLKLMFSERTPRYSRALMETLSIIAYRQPVTRGDIEAIRGVSVSSSIMKTLNDRNWVRIIGYRDVPGKPAMFSTTPEFLDYFGLKKLEELPELTDTKEPINYNLDLEGKSLETSENSEDFVEIENYSEDPINDQEITSTEN
ncbi:MAG TPA: SMC-Scp complex subunit ScpB [Gammaproteobacteria bacterium]|jgi:segregation and condensation protein B|nr:SMC-Scp complex subunit ScpB [Gammaproteobacteria bacterium]